MTDKSDSNGSGVDPNLITVDLDDLSVGEIELIEDACDMSIDSFGLRGVKKGKMMRAIAWVVAMRDNPNLRFEDAGNLKLDMSGMQDRVGTNVPPTGSDD